MFSTVLQELKGYFGRDFLLVAFFPVLLFAGLSGALYAEVAWGLAGALERWEQIEATMRIVLTLGGLLAVTVLAYLLYNGQYVIVRLFEGYWPRVRPFLWLRNRRVELYKKRWDYLNQLAKLSPPTESNEIYAQLLAFYPPSLTHLDKTMPTCLGNVLRAAEIYPYDRYGVDAAVIWPRLRPLLKPETMALLEDRKTSMTFMLSMTLLAAAFSLIWCPVLALTTNRWDLFLLCALGWPLAWFCYESAVQSALAYGDQLRATFDLYRHDLLKALGRPIPPDAEAERKEWLRLTRFFYRNLPPARPTAGPAVAAPGRGPRSRGPGRPSGEAPSVCKHHGGGGGAMNRPKPSRTPDPARTDRQRDNRAKPKPPRDPWSWLYWGLFFIVVPLVALWMAHKPTPQVSLPVPARDLPPYHVLAASDLTTASVPARQVTDETVRNTQDLVGRYSLQALPAGHIGIGGS